MSFDDVWSAYETGQFGTALKGARSLAAGGNISAQVLLGRMYRLGHGTSEDHTEALNWYLRAADSEHPEAMLAVMEYYRVGRGLRHRNPHGAAHWAERLAELGNPQAQTHIGGAYIDGYGVAKDPAQGREWLRQAADAGYSEAMRRLADAYRAGAFGERDYESALRWYQTAVRFGDEWAKLSVVRMLHDESLPVFDLEQSYFWALVGTAWAPEGSIIPEGLGREILTILYQVPEGLPSGTVNGSGLTGDGLSPDPSPSDYDYESWPRRLRPEAQRRVEAGAEDFLTRWPQPPMTQ